MKESQKAKKERALTIIKQLKSDYPDLECALDFSDPLQCTISTILSAQCTDARVNLVTPALFKKYPTVQAFADVAQETLEADIRSTGFFRNKAKSIRNCCRAILDRHDGRVPDTMEELVKLEGVGRKTANCVLGNAYGQPAVMVDTHVKRLTFRMGLTDQKNPDKIEFELKALLPEPEWLIGSHALIHHGRQVCKARKPACSGCSLGSICPKRGV